MSPLHESRLVVLTFHRVDDERLISSHGIPWEQFLHLLDWLSISRANIVNTFLPEEIGAPSILLRFDDGTLDHLRAAIELSQRGLPGVFFISSGRLGKSDYLGREEVQQLRQLGHVVGSHAHTHMPLSAKPKEFVHDELYRSKAILEEVTGQVVEFLAPPGGFVDASVRHLARKVGYRGLTTMRWGLCSRWWDSYDVPCLAITPWTIHRQITERTYAKGALPWEAQALYLLKAMLPGPMRSQARKMLNAGAAKIARFI